MSVFIPTYNAAPYLGQAIRSVLGQSHRELELLVLDDASTDDTAEVVRPHLTDQRVRYLRHEHNLGMSANWNRGLSLVRKPLVAKLDADDFYEPEFLAASIAALESSPRAGLAYCGCRLHSSTVADFLPFAMNWTVGPRQFLVPSLQRWTFHSPTIVAKRECYEVLGPFIERMRFHTDWEMWTRIVASYGVTYSSRILANYRRHQANCSNAARRDTRSPDDLMLWLDLLDANRLPYVLDSLERATLETAMAVTTNKLFHIAVHQKNKTVVVACAALLLRLRILPWFERLRCKLLKLAAQSAPRLLPLLAIGRITTQARWPTIGLLRDSFAPGGPLAPPACVAQASSLSNVASFGYGE